MSWRVEDMSARQRQLVAASHGRASWFADKRVKNDMPEADFQTVIIELATLRGWRYIWHDNDSRKNIAGKPDLELACPSRGYLQAELKTKNNKPRPEQQRVIDILRNAGVTVYVWTPTNWREIVNVLW